MDLQAVGFREQVKRLDEGLGSLGPHAQRQVRTLVREMAALWIGDHGPSHRTLVAEVAVDPSALRVDVFSDPPTEDPEFWTALVRPHLDEFVTRWEIDRRRSSGLWFVLPSA